MSRCMPVVIFLAILAACVSACVSDSWAGVRAVKSVDEVRNARFDQLDGTMKSLPDYKGKVLLLNFWASWCGPCFMEIPSLNRTHERYKSRGLEIVSLSVDTQYGLTKVGQIAKKAKMRYTVGRARREMIEEMKVFAIPISYLFGRDGKLVATYMGPPPAGKLEKDIEAALAK